VPQNQPRNYIDVALITQFGLVQARFCTLPDPTSTELRGYLRSPSRGRSRPWCCNTHCEDL